MTILQSLQEVPSLWRQRLYASSGTKRAVTDAFHNLYYDSWRHFEARTVKSQWMGVDTLKCPLDLWVYQELICRIRPDLILETGTLNGGSALFLAHMLELSGTDGEIVSIDVRAPQDWPEHARITYLTGSSTDPEIFSIAQEKATSAERVLVFLDSDHSRDHVRHEMALYANLVTIGSYLVVEDTNVNGHPVYPDHGPGPMEAVEDFLKTDTRFEIDHECEHFLLTMNPNGYLRRVA